jgi:hypothetical protein
MTKLTRPSPYGDGRFCFLAPLGPLAAEAASPQIEMHDLGGEKRKGENIMNGITTSELFAWLIGSGGLILVMSWLVEHWAWYQAQSSTWKKMLFIAGVVILGSAVHALQLYVPATAWAAIDPWFIYVSGLVVLGAGAMGLHAMTK